MSLFFCSKDCAICKTGGMQCGYPLQNKCYKKHPTQVAFRSAREDLLEYLWFVSVGPQQKFLLVQFHLFLPLKATQPLPFILLQLHLFLPPQSHATFSTHGRGRGHGHGGNIQVVDRPSPIWLNPPNFTNLDIEYCNSGTELYIYISPATTGLPWNPGEHSDRLPSRISVLL